MPNKVRNPFVINDLQAPTAIPGHDGAAPTVPEQSITNKIKKRGRARIDYSATQSTTMLDIARAAEFYEGEGCFDIDHSGERVQLGQNDREKLDWIRDRFGGKVYGPYIGSAGNDIYSLVMRRERALGFMYTIFTYLSKGRKEQFKTVLVQGGSCKRVYQPTISDKGISEEYFNRVYGNHMKKKQKQLNHPLGIFGIKR